MRARGAQARARSGAVAWPDHLAQLDEGWAVWRWVFLRSAGFPLSDMVRLADRPLAAAADRLLDAHRGKTTAEAEAAAEAYRHRFAEAAERLAGELERTARDERFREALVWHNRRVLETGIDPYLRQRAEGGARDAKARRRERLVTSYLQRYCTKNETNGFFGPIGWARLVDSAEPVAIACADRLLAARRVFLDQWGVDALAAAMEAEPALRPWLAPWRLPFLAVEDGLCRPPGAPAWRLTDAQRAVCEACDGRTVAVEIARRAVADPGLSLGSDEEVYGILSALESRGLVRWRLEVPLLDLDPAGALRRQLERVGDADLRSTLLRRLDELEAGRRAVAAAAGDSARLDGAVRELEGAFTRLTGREARRLAGRIFAGRTLVYEECRRGVEVELGFDLLDRLGPPLALLLASARWLSHELARSFMADFRRAYRDLCEALGTREVGVLSFLGRIRSLLVAIPRGPSPVDPLLEELRTRWLALLDLPGGRRRVEYRVEDLAPRVRERFAAPAPGWTLARHHSVDAMIDAASAEAIRRGEYRLVLGEIHPGTHLMRSIDLTQHPCLDEHRAALASDLPEPVVVLVPAKLKEQADGSNPLHAPVNSGRLDWGYVNPYDYELILSADPPTFERATLAIGELRVTERGGELRVVTADGRVDLDLLDVCGCMLTGLIIDNFEWLPARPHLPRICFDHLVVQRETWRLPIDGSGLQGTAGEAEAFLAVRRWVRDHDLPRFVFVRSPVERKPYFVDFDSPPCVALLVKAVRDLVRRRGADAHLVVSEMLPDPEHVWLPDAAGRRYTSELRMVALDLTARPSGGEPRAGGGAAASEAS